MFGNFSVRARQVVFAARVNAGQRGGKVIEMNDFLAALITEDQRNVGEKFFRDPVQNAGTYVNHSNRMSHSSKQGKPFSY